jgi:uncharacterized protein YlxP (DUF503 family)
MIIGYLLLELYLPYSHSLKEKRKRLKKIKDRLKVKYNVSYAELDFQDKWQRSRIGIVTLNNRKAVIEKIFRQIINDIEENIDGEILNTHLEYY